MAEKNLSYWELRQAQNMFDYMESAEQAAKEIAKLYKRAAGYLSSEMDEIFDKYKDKYGLSDQEAMRLLKEIEDKDSLNNLLLKLNESKNNQEREELRKHLEAPAYRARIERLQKLMDQIDNIMQNVYKQEQRISESFYADLANDTYYHSIYSLQQQAGVGFSFEYVDAKTIDRVINSRWSGKNYSERIWGNTEQLAKELKEELLLNLVTGRTNRDAAHSIAMRTGQGSTKARRLVRTESNHLATELNFEAYKNTGIKKYRFLAVLDLKTSEQCRRLDGKIFPVEDRKVGVNCPPMHPWCRSTTIAILNEEWLKDMQRSATDPATGEALLIPATMTYEDWYNKYVKGKPEVELVEKQMKNRSADRRQHKKYREILGDEVPEELDDFQKMKYTETDKWAYLKGLKSYLERYPESNRNYYDIQNELKGFGIKIGVPLPPEQKQAYILPEGTRDAYHIMHRMMERGITDDMIRDYITNAKCMFTQWGGQRRVFYGKEGACVITKSENGWIYKTAWTKLDFDTDSMRIMEVINKYVK